MSPESPPTTTQVYALAAALCARLDELTRRASLRVGAHSATDGNDARPQGAQRAGRRGSGATAGRDPAAIASNQRLSYGRRVRLDPRTELVIATDIAKRLGISPQRVYVLAAAPGFPKPLGTRGRSGVWRWSSIERWARETGRLPADDAAA